MIGWLVKKMFDRTVKSAEYFMRNDPRVKTAVISASAAIQKSEDDLMRPLTLRYGGTPEEIADKARRTGLSYYKYIKLLMLGEKYFKWLEKLTWTDECRQETVKKHGLSSLEEWKAYCLGENWDEYIKAWHEKNAEGLTHIEAWRKEHAETES